MDGTVGKSIGDWLRVFTACYCALALAMLGAKADPPTGNGSPPLNITSPNGTMTVGGTSYTPTIDVSGLVAQLAAAQTWTGLQTLQGVNFFIVGAAGNCSGMPAALASGICLAGNSASNVDGIILGPVTGGTACVASCTLQPSMQLCFAAMRSGGIALGSMCDWISAGGVRTIGGTSITTSGAPIQIGILRQPSTCSGTTPLTAPAGDFVCRVTAAANTLTLTFAAAYTSIPACVASDETTNAGINKVTPSTSAVTVTTVGAADIVDIHCVGNGT